MWDIKCSIFKLTTATEIYKEWYKYRLTWNINIPLFCVTGISFPWLKFLGMSIKNIYLNKNIYDEKENNISKWTWYGSYWNIWKLIKHVHA
jgi:hypothetical protein